VIARNTKNYLKDKKHRHRRYRFAIILFLFLKDQKKKALSKRGDQIFWSVQGD
jgi:hypothetical protein